MKLEELRKALREKLVAMRDVSATVEALGRDFTDDERKQVQTMANEAKGIREQIDRAKQDQDLLKEISELGDGVDPTSPTGSRDVKVSTPTGRSERRKSLGEQFIEADAFKAWIKQVAPGGQIPDGLKGISSPPIEFKTLLTGAGSGSAGDMVVSEQKPLVPLGRRPVRLRDVVTQGTTTSDTIEFARILAETNAAAMVAEATSSAAGGTGVKPESAFTFERVTTSVKQVAHWIPATKRALSDAGQLRTLIDSFLEDGLEQKLEDQMATGNATGENFDGIGNMSGTQSQAFDTDLFTTTRKARTKVVTVGRAIPQAYLFNPTDWEVIQLSQNNNGDYYYGGPAQQGPETHWRLPVIEVEAIPAGTAYVGDFRKCVLADRESATISVSDSHSDFFIKNMVAILAELRAAFYCIQPSAIVEIALS